MALFDRAHYDILLAFHCNYVPISHRFRDSSIILVENRRFQPRLSICGAPVLVIPLSSRSLAPVPRLLLGVVRDRKLRVVTDGQTDGQTQGHSIYPRL